MIQDIYIRVFNLIRIKSVSLLIAYLFNIFYRGKFFLKKLLRHKCVVKMSSEKANEIICNVYPRNTRKVELVNQNISDILDLSIVVTVYNYESKLEKNILSCINQETKYRYEVIFVNDGSTDSSAYIISKYVDNDKVKLINKENGGAASARNAGINVASGKYIMFVDCDDILHNDIVEKLLNTAFFDDADIVACAHNLVKTKNEEIISTITYIYPNINLLSYKNSKMIMNYPGFPWGKVYKREMFNKIRYPEGYWYEDTITLFLLFTQCQSFEYIEEPLYDYYIHDSNITKTVSNTTNVKVIDRYWILREIIDVYLEEGNIIDSGFYELLLRHTSLFYYNNIKNLDNELVEALFVAARDLILYYRPTGKVKLPYMLKQVEKSFQSNDITLWKLASVYQ